MYLRISLISACIFALLSTNLSADAGFKGLGGLSSSKTSGQVYGMSDDGLVVVGDSYFAEIDDWQAFRWTESGMVGLGYLTGHNVSSSDHVSGDGLTIIGSGYNWRVDNSDKQFIWTMANGMEEFVVDGEATTLSFDGSVVGGELNRRDALDKDTGRNEAFIRSGGVTTTLGFLETPDADSNSNVVDISNDGMIVIGNSSSAEGGGTYRWTQADGMVALGDALDGGARAVSGDGDTIVGRMKGVYPYRIYIWTETEGATQLFDNIPDDWSAGVIDISADGSTVVGEMWQGFSSSPSTAWRWSKLSGMQTIKEWLSEAGVDSTDWYFQDAFAVSSNGNIVSGTVIKPDGGYEPYIAWVTGGTPKPDLIMGGLGGSFEEPEIP